MCDMAYLTIASIRHKSTIDQVQNSINISRDRKRDNHKHYGHLRTKKIAANKTADTAPEAPKALYHELFRCRIRSGIDDAQSAVR